MSEIIVVAGYDGRAYRLLSGMMGSRNVLAPDDSMCDSFPHSIKGANLFRTCLEESPEIQGIFDNHSQEPAIFFEAHFSSHDMAGYKALKALSQYALASKRPLRLVLILESPIIWLPVLYREAILWGEQDDFDCFAEKHIGAYCLSNYVAFCIDQSVPVTIVNGNLSRSQTVMNFRAAVGYNLYYGADTLNFDENSDAAYSDQVLKLLKQFNCIYGDPSATRQMITFLSGLVEKTHRYDVPIVLLKPSLDEIINKNIFQDPIYEKVILGGEPFITL